MPKDNEDTVQVVGSSVKGVARNLILMRGLPGMIAVTAWAGDKSVIVVVSAAELRAAIDRLDKI